MARKPLPNELIAEIIDTIPANAIIAHFVRLEKKAAGTVHRRSGFYNFILNGIGKLPITPTNCWNSDQCSAKLSFSTDRLIVTFKGRSGFDAMLSTLPIPLHIHQGIFYFEIYLKNEKYVCIGLNYGPEVPQSVNSSIGSCGLHSGGLFWVANKGYDYGYGHWPGDCIGCGVHLATRQLFYTKNGRYLGIATVLPEIDGNTPDLYPVISLWADTVVETNFGRKSFHYQFISVDLEKMGKGDGPRRWQKWDEWN